MRGATLMEIILICTIIVCIVSVLFMKSFKPQDHAFKSEIERLENHIADIVAKDRQAALEQRISYNEMKIQKLASDSLNMAEQIGEATDLISESDKKIEDELNDVHEHVARMQKSVQTFEHNITDTVDVRIKNMKPLLVQMMHDQNLRTYTIEKIIKTKDGYKKKSMTRVLSKKKAEDKKIQKLHLPGVHEAVTAWESNKL